MRSSYLHKAIRTATAEVFRRRENLDGIAGAAWRNVPCIVVPALGQSTSASTIARLQSESGRALADEAQKPLAQLLASPQDDDDLFAVMKANIRAARGKALLLETSAAGWGKGKTAAPQRDWQASRLGPQPPESMAMVKQTFATVLAACGCSAALYDDSDGTSEREARRIFLHGTVRPSGKMLSTELSAKLDTPITLNMVSTCTT